jgi:hypothetical protein
MPSRSLAAALDDTTILRLEKVRAALQTAHVAAQVEAATRAAILAVALTVGAGAAIAQPGPLSNPFQSIGVVASAAVVGFEVRGLARVSKALRAANDRAQEAIDKLMGRGGE